AVNALAGGAMPVAAGVRGEVGAAAVSALVLVPAQQRRAANVDGVEDLPVVWREPMRAGISRQAGPQYFGQQQRGRTRDWAPGRFWTTARHRRLAGGQLVEGTDDAGWRGRWRRIGQLVERALDLGQVLPAHVQILAGGRKAGVGQ